MIADARTHSDADRNVQEQDGLQTTKKAALTMHSSSEWDGDVLRLSRFQEQGFGTGVRGSVQHFATWLSPCAATSGGCVGSPGIEALYTRDMFPVVSSSVVRSPYVYYR